MLLLINQAEPSGCMVSIGSAFLSFEGSFFNQECFKL